MPLISAGKTIKRLLKNPNPQNRKTPKTTKTNKTQTLTPNPLQQTKKSTSLSFSNLKIHTFKMAKLINFHFILN